MTYLGVGNSTSPTLATFHQHGKTDHPKVDRADCMVAESSGCSIQRIEVMEADFKKTSTTKPFWEMDCDKFLAAGVAFKVASIETPEHRQFVSDFAAKHHWVVAHGDGAAYFCPPSSGSKGNALRSIPVPRKFRTVDPEQHSSFLIVENDPNDAFLIQRALSTANCGHASLCRNPSEAKAFLKGAGMYADREKYPFPDLILTDLRMQDELGTELVEWIRSREPPIRDIKVLILTGSATPMQFAAAQKVGAQGVHRKPSKLEDLEKLLASIAAEYCKGK